MKKTHDEVAPLYVVIASAGRACEVLPTLQSLDVCKKPPNFRSFILVENGPNRNLENVASFSSVSLQYFYCSRSSKSNALNLAINSLEVEEALIYFTDDDVVFDEDTLMAIAKSAEAHGPGYYFGGSVAPIVDREIPKYLEGFLPLSVTGSPPNSSSEFYSFLGCNWAAFVSDIRKVGEFDIRFGPGSPLNAVGQEFNMQSRMFLSGMRPVSVERAKVYHDVPQECLTARWALKRRYREGIYKGLVPREMVVPVVSKEKKASGFVPVGGWLSISRVFVIIICGSAEMIGRVKGATIRICTFGAKVSSSGSAST